MSSFMCDDEPLGLPLMTSDLSPTGDSVNVLDMISQDVMLGNSYQNTISSASTEVTYTSQYAARSSATPFVSAAPFTSAGDVFLPSMPVTTIANTFVKPLHTYVPPSHSRTILKPNPMPAYRPTNLRPENLRLAYRSANLRPENPRSVYRPANPRPENLKSAYRPANPRPENSRPAFWRPPNPFEDNPIIPNQTPVARTPITESSRSKPEKSRKPSKKSSSSSKISKSKSHASHKSSSRSRSSKQSSRSRSKPQSLLLPITPPPSAFVPTSTRGALLRSTTVTHTVTRAENTVTKSVVRLATESVTYTTTTVAVTFGRRATASAQSTCKTATVTSCKATRSQSPVTVATCTYRKFPRSDSNVSGHNANKPRTPASLLHPGPTLSRTPAAGGEVRPPASPTTEKSREQFAKLSTQTKYVIPANATDRVSTKTKTTTRSKTRFVVPVMNTYVTSAGSIVTTTVSALTRQRVTHTVRPTQSAHFLTKVQTHVTPTTTNTTAAAASRTLTQSKFALPPGATFYAARKVPSAKTTQSRTAVTTGSQTFTILDSKGSVTTLTISSDFTATSGSPLVHAHTQCPTTRNAGDVSHTTTTATMILPQNRYIIPIANSQMNTSTSLGYLVTSPIGSEIITTRHSAVPTTQSATTTATAIGSHTIAAINSETLNRIRSQLLCNTPGTTPGPRSLSPSTASNRPRGPVTIIAKHLISTVTPRDDSGTLSTADRNAPSPTRTLFSAGSTQGLYAITTPITTHSSSSTTPDPAGRPFTMVVPLMSNVHASSNDQNSSTTQKTYLTTGTLDSKAGDATAKTSRVLLNPRNKSALISTSVPTTTTRPLDASGSAHTSSVGTSDVHSKLRNRLTAQVTTTGNSTPGSMKPVTAYTYTRNRPSQSVHIPCVMKSSAARTLSPATMTLLTFSKPTTAGASAASSPHRLRAMPAVRGNSPKPTTLSVMTTATPTLTNTGNRYVIKLATSPNAGTSSMVTTAVTTPITTAAVSPPDHQFLEPHPLPSRPRTFPGPRTYSVAQRLAAGNAQQSPARNVSTRPKKVITNPAPLQIFADVVCPRTTIQSPTTTTATQGQSKTRFTHSHSSGNSTLVVPQYKNTVSKNVSTIAQHNPERTSSRLLNPRASSDRLVINRSVAYMTPRLTAPSIHSVAHGTHSTSTFTQRSVRAAHLDTRAQAAHDSAAPGIDSTKIGRPSQDDQDNQHN